MRVLVHVQANLDGDLSLTSLAEVAALSPFHFAREFARATGETVKQYTQRLRLERAAVRLRLHRGPILEVALDSGFRNHETFTRAFRSRFAMAPRAYRGLGLAAPSRARQPGGVSPEAAPAFSLSATRVRELGDLSLAFIRHEGPYECVGEEPFDALSAWARAHRVREPKVWLGIGHDVPGVTPEARLRFDAALVVPEPFAGRGRVGYQRLPAATYAVTTHVGPYASLGRAHAEIFRRIARFAGWRTLGVPILELYLTTRVNARLALNHTDVYVPLERAPRARSRR